MSHDRGCFQCGAEPHEYRDCRRHDCVKKDVVGMQREASQPIKHMQCTACPDIVTVVNGRVVCPYTDCPMRSPK